VLSEAKVYELCDCALDVWEPEVGLMMGALISVAAFVGARPAEMYGLRWADLDFRYRRARLAPGSPPPRLRGCQECYLLLMVRPEGPHSA
jgi:integrase